MSPLIFFLYSSQIQSFRFSVSVLTPSPCGHSPYLICDEQRESVDTLMCFLCCGYLFNSSVTSCYLPYILRCKNTPQCCGTRQGRRVLVFNILALPLFSLLLFSTGTFPIGRGRTDMLFLIFFSTPSPFGHSPYIPFRNTEGERYASLFSRYRRY